MRGPIKCTLLELVCALNEVTENDREVVAAAISLVNSGRVQLCGNFANAKIVCSLGFESPRAVRPLSVKGREVSLFS